MTEIFQSKNEISDQIISYVRNNWRLYNDVVKAFHLLANPTKTGRYK
jgi:hypothetical protein